MWLFLTQHLENVMHSLTYFQQVKNENFQNRFFLYPLAPGKWMCSDSYFTYHRLLSWHTAKAPRVWLQQVPPRADAGTSLLLEISTPSWYVMKIWGQLDVRCALRTLLCLWEVKKSFIGNWVEVVTLAVIGEHIYLILFSCAPCFIFFYFYIAFWRKKYSFCFCFLFFIFWLAPMGYLRLASRLFLFFCSFFFTSIYFLLFFNKWARCRAPLKQQIAGMCWRTKLVYHKMKTSQLIVPANN